MECQQRWRACRIEVREERERPDMIDQCRTVHWEFHDVELCTREQECGDGGVIECEVSEKCRVKEQDALDLLDAQGCPTRQRS
jgi:hypothetical protein